MESTAMVMVDGDARIIIIIIIDGPKSIKKILFILSVPFTAGPLSHKGGSPVDGAKIVVLSKKKI